MEQQLSSLNTAGPIDFDNLNIVTHPRPPRRRQSGISLVPFRPYVKCLTSTREPFSFANGEDPWSTSGQKETFFKQANARCIGSLLDDCDVSDVIRWDIQPDSTRLPMMCKLWMIGKASVNTSGIRFLVLFFPQSTVRSSNAANRIWFKMPLSRSSPPVATVE